MPNDHQETASTAPNGIDPASSALLADQAKASAVETTDAARHQTDVLRETIEDGTKAARDQIGTLQQSVQSGGTTIAEAVRRNPGLAVGGAVGLGLLVGLALNRR